MFRLLEDPTQKPTEVLYNLSLKGASASSASLASHGNSTLAKGAEDTREVFFQYLL
jgi:hypothetical protein